MRFRGSILLFGLIFLLAAWVPSQVSLAGFTRLELEDPTTGRKLLSQLLADGEQVVLTWRNSIFGQDVTEVFVVRNGELVLEEVTFVEPGNSYQMPVTPDDVDDLYHTGGPFSAKGLSRSFREIVFRIGEIGNPKLHVAGQVVEMKKAVGFGGRVVLTTRRPSIYEYALFWLRSVLL